jgi:hypothetical protein
VVGNGKTGCRVGPARTGSKGNHSGKGVRGGHSPSLRRCHLGCHGPLALQFFLVPIERLLSTIFEVSAVVVFRQTVLWTNGTNLDVSGAVSV